MSVEVKIIGGEANSDEFEAALQLKDIINRDIGKNVDGEILLYASATILGQEVKDIDLVMIGELTGYSQKSLFFDSNNLKNTDVTIKNFCTTIEIKSHSVDGIFRKGTDFYVSYGSKAHNVTTQSNKQKYSLMNFFKQTLSFSPYISNLIWFTQLSQEDIHNLLSTNEDDIKSNVFSSDFTFNQIMQLIVWQNKPFYLHGNYIINSNPNNIEIDKFQNAMKVFSEKRTTLGNLTRKRIEEISNAQFRNINLDNEEDSMEIIRGKAGSGKTVGLINHAIYLVDNYDSRVLMLTYNKALVSDLKRIFTFAEIPDMFQEKCLDINTMQSFFFAISNNILFNGNLSGEFYINYYNETLNKLLIYLEKVDSLEFVKEYMKTEISLDWDYILIDEAQDWSALEKDIILKLYEPNKIIIADGGNQFVRNIDVCDWTNIKKKKSIKLKYCLRQKRNLVYFINHFSNKIGQNINKIKPNNSMLGGKIILSSNDNINIIHENEFNSLLSYGNIGYDMLYLVPSNMVAKTNSGNHFKLSDEYKQKGINFWDGTNQTNRNSFSINEEEVRLFQYDSCRGLEAWTVVCINFDVYIEEKLNYFSDDIEVNSLYLESVEDKKRKYILNWALIPLTRAIDTLVITLSNEDSYISKILIELADEYSDYITMIK